MNDEIKEILEYLGNDNIEKPFGMATIDKHKLLNYITNLQQEKPHLHTNTEWEDLLDYKGRTYIELERFKQVKQENERLKEEKDNLYLDNIMLKMEKDIYKQGYEDLKDLLNTLQNGSEKDDK